MLYFKGCGKHFCLDHGVPHGSAYSQIEKLKQATPPEGAWQPIMPYEDHYMAKKSFNQSVLRDDLSDDLFAFIAHLNQEEIRFCHECQYSFKVAVQKQQKRLLMLKIFSVLIPIIVLLLFLLVSLSSNVQVAPCSQAHHLFYPSGVPCPIAREKYTMAKACDSVSESLEPGILTCNCPKYFKYDSALDLYCVQPKC